MQGVESRVKAMENCKSLCDEAEDNDYNENDLAVFISMHAGPFETAVLDAYSPVLDDQKRGLGTRTKQLLSRLETAVNSGFAVIKHIFDGWAHASLVSLLRVVDIARRSDGEVRVDGKVQCFNQHCVSNVVRWRSS